MLIPLPELITNGDTAVRIWPRYLAGHTGDDLDLVVRPLQRLGWQAHNGRGLRLHLTSPCLRARYTYRGAASEQAGTELTTLDSERWPRWRIAFSAGTPDEFIQAVTLRLAEALAEDPCSVAALRQRTTVPLPPVRGWTPTGAGPGAALAPDGRARYRIDEAKLNDPAPSTGWVFSGGVGTGAWEAAFSRRTPESLLLAMHEAVTSNDTAQRLRRSVPRSHRLLVKAHYQSPPTPPGKVPDPKGRTR